LAFLLRSRNFFFLVFHLHFPRFFHFLDECFPAMISPLIGFLLLYKGMGAPTPAKRSKQCTWIRFLRQMHPFLPGKSSSH
jgi:hypothetical protein